MSIRAELPLGNRHFDGFRELPDMLEADACIIGSGASGAVVADTLRDYGWSVIMVEEGALLSRGVSQEMVDRVSPKAEVLCQDGWKDRGWPWTTRNVGGGTLFYGGASFRYRDCDFDARKWLPGIGLDVAWPMERSDLVPFYDLIEHRLNISGSQQPMTLPAEVMADAARRLGYKPFPTPMTVNKPACKLERLCVDYQCPNGAKSDVITIYLKRLASDPGFTLISGVRGIALEQQRAEQANALRCLELNTGTVRRIHAHHFFVAGNAIQSAALLLRSVTSFAPNGIGNRNDLVGRGLCMKLSQYVRGMAPVPRNIKDHAVGLRGPFSTVSIMDHYLDENCPSGMGGLIYEARSLAPQSEPIKNLPLELEVIIADTPAFHNRVRLSPNRDEWGEPKIIIDYKIVPHDLQRLAYMTDQASRILRHAGVNSVEIKRARSELGSTHLHGTCRSGSNPATSVLDPYCRVHDQENVYVVDGSFMPFPGGLNPTLTIQANALRVARYVAGASSQ